MPPLSDEQLRAFARRGYLVVPGVVSSALLEEATAAVDRTIERDPPPPGHRGFHHYWNRQPEDADPLMRLLRDSDAWTVAGSLIAPLTLQRPGHVQLSITIPISHHRPGGPHLDGLSITEPDGRPGTFTVLAGILLSEQRARDMGNLWVWPGSHHVAAAYLREHGPDALFDLEHPSLPFAPPEQVLGGPGDLLLAHYLLGHNMGGNVSGVVRRAVYWRLHATGHRERWRDLVRDPLLEFAPVRDALARAAE